MTLTREQVLGRVDLFDIASNLVGPIVEQHGLDKYPVGPAPFLGSASSIMTPVDQHLDHILRVADWLLDKDG